MLIDLGAHRSRVRDVARLASRVNLIAALKSGGNATTDVGHRRRVQDGLVVSQVAVSVVLLVGSRSE